MTKMDKRSGRQYRYIPLEFRGETDDNKMMIKGYFSVFYSDYELFPGFTESIDPHAFDKTITGDIRALWNHDTNIVLGRTSATPPTLSIKIDSHGLYGEILINPEDQDAVNAYARIKRGDVRECSFGFDIISEKITELSNGNWHSDILEVELYEVSPCAFPAYKETSISARSDEIKELRKREVALWKAQAKARLNK